VRCETMHSGPRRARGVAGPVSWGPPRCPICCGDRPGRRRPEGCRRCRTHAGQRLMCGRRQLVLGELRRRHRLRDPLHPVRRAPHARKELGGLGGMFPARYELSRSVSLCSLGCLDGRRRCVWRLTGRGDVLDFLESFWAGRFFGVLRQCARPSPGLAFACGRLPRRL
jgi:hypothetical protein